LRLTLRHFLAALKIAARLSILGLTLGESIRCKLLLGMAVVLASRSKPSHLQHRPRSSESSVHAQGYS
jgi:hypothetical protein